jgi:hypothetical protein
VNEGKREVAYTLNGNGRKFVAINHLTDWTKQLIAHARGALFMQQMKANVVVFDS